MIWDRVTQSEISHLHFYTSHSIPGSFLHFHSKFSIICIRILEFLVCSFVDNGWWCQMEMLMKNVCAYVKLSEG
ncbi:hypothetical protein RJT34_17380 [Clitoria ternatea]|uniref:Uncharacterized protein n=1 Tax=Clitoria ternatea TaxID=43366 RepID=A0AAN9JA73_CLITE